MPQTPSITSLTQPVGDRPCLSLVIPVFNEAATIRPLVEGVRTALTDYSYEVVIVDDGSTDGTAALVDALADGVQVRKFIHPVNLGKGAALRTGFQQARGQVVVIQDADLEYAPADIPQLVQPILDGKADVVYGSRFRGGAPRSAHFWHRLANMLLTTLSNVFNDLHLTDMETGYKAFRAEVIKDITVRENRWGRAGADGQNRSARLPDRGSADFVQQPRLFPRQEDRLSRRRAGRVVPAAVQRG